MVSRECECVIHDPVNKSKSMTKLFYISFGQIYRALGNHIMFDIIIEYLPGSRFT